MKTFIVATLLSVGVLLRPEMAPTVNDAQAAHQPTLIGSISQTQPTASALGYAEMATLQGAGIIECGGYIDTDGDAHQMCCINLWLFKICGDLNVSAAHRLISSLL